MKNCLALSTLAAALVAAFPALAQTAAPTQLDPVVVSAERSRQTTFDAPAAISAVTRETIENGGPQVNLSEVLNRVPGISVLNRQNYAQDLQLSIRGFGSRSTFGIRGVRLIVDGIPATMPDGQGQASNIALSSAERVEVLRGPLAQLYGNAAGGVVQVFTDMDAAPSATVSAALGPDSLKKAGVRLNASGPADSVVLDASTFRTGGYREHSAARRDQINGKWQHDVSRDTRFSLVVNSLDQPLSQDPLGLTRAQFEANPQQAVALAKTQNAGKKVLQQQIGGVLEQRLGDNTELSARLYFGQRDLDNALSIPPAAQTAATASGGIVSFQRGYMGLAAQVSHAVKFGDGWALRLVGGVEADESNEDRQGYLNTAGVQGALKRDEFNQADNRDVFVQASLDLGPQWTATAGLRSSRVKFRSTDNFIVTGNPDDSGGVSYSATSPVVGLTWRASPALNLYANAGRGFETPTFTELSYRPNGLTGLNTDLLASRSRHAELGAKWKLAEGHRVDVAWFDITTRDEIVVNTNAGGRSTFKNAGKTRRYGAELSYLARLGEDWSATLSVTGLRARFSDAFVSGTGAAAVTVPAGSRLAGTPNKSGFAELAWAPKGAWGGFNTAVEVVHTGVLYVNDVNEDYAPAATVVNLRAGLSQKAGPWTFSQLVRVDNASDKAYAGSVIVNDANKRFFEPAQPRNWLLAATAKFEWQ